MENKITSTLLTADTSSLRFPVKCEQRRENPISFSSLNMGIIPYGLKRMGIEKRINSFTDFSDNLFNIDYTEDYQYSRDL